MDCLVTLEQRLYRNCGMILTEGMYDYRFWLEKKGKFDNVKVAARVQDGHEEKENLKPVEGEGVSVIPLPNVGSPLDILKEIACIRRAVKAALADGPAIILRVPGIVSSIVWLWVIGRRKYGVEVVGDPKEVFSEGSVEMKGRGVYKLIGTYLLRLQCRHSVAAAYVTAEILQERYPSKGLRVHYSTVSLDHDAYIAEAAIAKRLERTRNRLAGSGPVVVSCIGTLEQRYKGQDLLIEAVRLARGKGYLIDAVLIGDGKYREMFEEMVSKYELEEAVIFKGHISDRNEIIRLLDESDIYCQPSRTEGMPRATIEAMARGLPVIATSVGGLVEIVPKEGRIVGTSSLELASLLIDLLKNPSRLERIAVEGFKTSGEYSYSTMKARRDSFYDSLSTKCR